MAWLTGSQSKGWQKVVDSYVEAFGVGLMPSLARVMLLENDHGWLVLKFFDSYEGLAEDAQFSWEEGTELPPRGGTRLVGLDEWQIVFDTAADPMTVQRDRAEDDWERKARGLPTDEPG